MKSKENKNIYIVYDEISHEDYNTSRRIAFVSNNSKEIDKFLDNCFITMKNSGYSQLKKCLCSGKKNGFCHRLSVDNILLSDSEYDPNWYLNELTK